MTKKSESCTEEARMRHAKTRHIDNANESSHLSNGSSCQHGLQPISRSVYRLVHTKAGP